LAGQLWGALLFNSIATPAPAAARAPLSAASPVIQANLAGAGGDAASKATAAAAAAVTGHATTTAAKATTAAKHLPKPEAPASVTVMGIGSLVNHGDGAHANVRAVAGRPFRNQIRFVAAREVAAGEQLLMSYVPTGGKGGAELPEAERRARLNQQYMFEY
jgi:hypothetical protein